MSIIQRATRGFATPSITGRAALLCCIITVAVPTFLRASIHSVVTGLGFTPFVPFVLIAAIFLEWYYAAAVAVVSALIGDVFFTGLPLQLLEEPSDVFGMLAFLSASTLIIAFAHLTRRLVQDYGRLSKEHLAHSGIVFSLQDGQAWASWYGPGSRVCLGPQDEVAEMMEDFLAQLELGKRLNGRAGAAEPNAPASLDSSVQPDPGHV